MVINAKKQSIIALIYFLIAASLGILLRVFPVTNVEANYKYIVHTHSHIALLGWVYVALTATLFHLFIRKDAQKKYAPLFWCTQVTILGMLLSFPITGYALFSIIFSTLFLICSYWCYAFFRKHNNCKTENYSFKFINASLLFMVISSIGPWLLGIIMNTLGNNSHWYKNAIYFYLHFQYNGWFLLCLFGLFLAVLEKHKIKIKKSNLIRFYKLAIISCVLTLFLSFLWVKPNLIIYITAFIGAVLQVFMLFYFNKIVAAIKSDLSKKITPFSLQLLKVVYALFIFKILLQLLTAFPFFAELASQIKDFVIGYLHLIFLGIVSTSLFVFFNEFKLLKLSKIWIQIYLLGFLLSEIIIFYKGFCNWQQLSIIENYYLILVLVSALIPISIFGMLIINAKTIFSTPKEYH